MSDPENFPPKSVRRVIAVVRRVEREWPGLALTDEEIEGICWDEDDE